MAWGCTDCGSARITATGQCWPCSTMATPPMPIQTAWEKSNTQRLTPDLGRRLQQADSVRFYHENGWACATGFDRAGTIVVKVHAASEDDIRQAMSPSPYPV